MTVIDPDRFYTPYQRREVIRKLAEKFSCTITDAVEKFKVMEFENADGLKQIIAQFPADPPKQEIK